MNALWKKIKAAHESLCLVDRFLILFMAALFVYMTLHLLLGSVATEETKATNIIVRTSAAAIFGYFISSNFIKEEADAQSERAIRQETQYTNSAADTQPHALAPYLKQQI